ncbi:leucine-rich repeat receptor-like serine/threonine-protein kinase At1g17230 [Ziziphus jujuba]|uniref:Leucine-rich repeat receptor-like serine/threonine-protein kinase At1g17230 n=1 Tax=Ziziphus jujuba TaxID=326968 RepID=A0A6P3ZY69_ZIZJJ|nr:leucine-rich repeat receptor-like serine/threonine-protein kinase At1g17230 [Ziziphus jujuba]
MAQMGLLGFLFSLLVLVTISSPRSVCGNAEVESLMELKSSLDPENRFLRSWTKDGNPCSGLFEGVACNEHQKVANITLQGKGLSGKISPAVAELKCLSGLYLHYNNLSGGIPREISNLTELAELYLDFNSLSGEIPSEIGNLASLQVLQLCCNQLTGSIPNQMGSLKRLAVIALQHNRLTGAIPASLGNLETLKMLNLSFNSLFGPIPTKVANIQSLETLNVRNNSLSGVAPPTLKRLNGEFHGENNPNLCGIGFPELRVCTPFDIDKVNVDGTGPVGPNMDNTAPKINPESANFRLHCNQTHCTNPTGIPRTAFVAVVITVTIAMTGTIFLVIFRYRRKKQKIGSISDPSDGRLSTDQAKEFYSRSASPLVTVEYCSGWDPLGDGRKGNSFFSEYSSNYRFNMEEIESATQYFSEVNLLGRSKFSAVYRGVLRDGSVVAIRSFNVTSCKSEEAEFVKGLNLLFSLRHENLVRLRGFCCSRSRGECFLIYDFVPKGNLSRYLDLEDGINHQVLDWSKRVAIISGIAEGIGYLHSSEADKPALVHQNISVEKILIDQQFNPLISDSGLPKILADDIVFSALKVSAAMGYLAPEYISTGRFTEKSDIYAFGVIVLQVLSGKCNILTNSMRLAANSSRFEDFIDPNLNGEFSESEATKLAELALNCTHELPDERPTMKQVIGELSNLPTSS